MRILLTNDDGIHADGLACLERIAKTLSDDVWVVAPSTDQSGVAHSLSLSDPLRLRTISARHHALKGTPTDCVIFGVRHLLKDNPPDLILSGVNSGTNIAEDVTYSGTIAGAIEGTLLGIPSFALSLAYGPAGRDNAHWDCAEQHAPGIIRKVLANGIPRDVLINLNFPDCGPAEIKGIAVAVQGRRDAQYLKIEERADGRGLPYYWIGFTRHPQTPGHGTDLEAMAQKKISITPLRINMTDEPELTRLASLFG